MHVALDRVRQGDDDPRCPDCAGILKSATISFGQNLDSALIERTEAAAATCNLFLAIGTSLTVYPVARLPGIALEAGARLVIVNAEPTPLDRRAHAVLRGQAGELLPALVEATRARIGRWNG
jgi:NAD-dependent deacetylase